MHHPTATVHLAPIHASLTSSLRNLCSSSGTAAGDGVHGLGPAVGGAGVAGVGAPDGLLLAEVIVVVVVALLMLMPVLVVVRVGPEMM